MGTERSEARTGALPAGRVLVVGGYGLVGTYLTKLLTTEHPELRITIAGRNPENGERLAAAHPRVELAFADLNAPRFPEPADFDVVVTALTDHNLALSESALRHGKALVPIATMSDQIAPLIALQANLRRGRLALLGYWQAGVITLATMDAVQEFGAVERISMTAIYDPADPLGPMAESEADGFDRHALIREKGAWRHVEPEKYRRVFDSETGPVPVTPIGVLDTPGLAAATGADDVRFDFGTGESVGTRAGSVASHDIYLTLVGQDPGGTPLTRDLLISGPQGGSQLTAVGVALVSCNRSTLPIAGESGG